MKPVRVHHPNVDTDADIVGLHAWAEPSHRFARLCDDATTVFAASHRDVPALCNIAAELISTINELVSIDKTPAKTRRAVGVLTSIADHTEAEVFSAINWIKRLGTIGQQPTTTTPTHRPPRSRRGKRVNNEQQTLWNDQ